MRKTVSVFARISATNGSAQFSLRSNLVGGTGKHERGQCWPGAQSIHVLAGNLTQELPEVPERGHDMSAEGKSLWRSFWRNAVPFWLGFDPWLSSCAIRFTRIVAPEAVAAVADMATPRAACMSCRPPDFRAVVSFAGSTRGGGGGNLARFVQSSRDGLVLGVCL